MGAPFYYFAGDDEFLVDRAARECFARLTADAEGDFAKEIIDGAAQKVDDAEQALATFSSAVQTLSLFGDKKFVWLRGLSWLADTVLGRSEGGKMCLEQLQALLENNDPAATAIVVSAYPVDRRRKEAKWFEGKGESTVVSAAKDPAALAEMIRVECAAQGVEIGRDGMEALIGKVGGNSRLILEEIRKLACYLGADGGRITPELVLALVPNFGEGDFFEPVEAFYSGDLEWALASLRRFFYHEPQGGRALVSSLQNRNRLLIQLRVLVDAGEIRIGRGGIDKADWARAAEKYGRYFGGAEEKSSLNVFTQNAWYLGNKVGVALPLFTLKNLTELQLGLVDAFEGILQRPNEQEAVFRELFVRTLGGR